MARGKRGGPDNRTPKQRQAHHEKMRKALDKHDNRQTQAQKDAKKKSK